MATITTHIRYAANTVELVNNLRQGAAQIEVTTAAANRMTAALSGEKLIRSAHNVVAALNEIGGVTKLNTQEQQRYLAVLEKSIDKMERMGQVVPTSMRQWRDELQSATAAANGKASAWDRVDGALGKVGLSIRGLGLGGLVTGLISIGKQAVDAAGQIVDLADKTKLSTTAVQQYGYAAKMTGGELTQWADAVFKLGVNIETGGTKVRSGLSGMGLEYERIKALQPEQQFDTIMRALASIEGPQERNRLGVELMGKGYANVAAAVDQYVQLLNEAPVAGEAAVKATSDAAEAVERAWARAKTAAISAIGTIVLASERGSKAAADVANRDSWASSFQNLSLRIPGMQFAYGLGLQLRGEGPEAQSADVSRRLGSQYGVGESLPAVGGQPELQDLAKRADAARAAIAALSAETRRQIDAGLKLGESMEVLGDRFNLSADAQRMYSSVSATVAKTDTDAQRAARERAEALADISARLTDLSPLQQQQVEALLRAGNAENDIAVALGLTARQVQLVSQVEKLRVEAVKAGAAEMKVAEEQRLAVLAVGARVHEAVMKQEINLLNARTKQTVDNFVKTRDLEDQAASLTLARSLSTHNQQVLQIHEWAEEMKAGFRGTTAETVRFYNAIDALTKAKLAALATTWRTFFSRDLVGAIMSAVTGGGNVGQAIGASIGNMLGDSLSRSLGDSISKKGKLIEGPLTKMFGSAVSGVMTALLPGIGALAGTLITKGLGALGSALGFGSAGRDLVKQYAEKMGGFDALRGKLAALGDQGEYLWRVLTQGVGKNNADEAKRAIQMVEDGLASYEEQQRVVGELQQELQGQFAELLGAVDAFGGRAPAALRPMVEELLRMTGLTAEQQLLLSDLLDEPGWQEMEAAAGRLGVAIGALGPAFQQAKLSEQALQTVRDLKFLEEGGADMNAVLLDSTKHIQELVTTAMATGSQLPATLQPYIQKLIDLGRLVDPKGELITNIDQLSFADIKDDALEAIKGILEQIRDLLQNQIPNAARTAQGALNGVRPPSVPEPAENGYFPDGSIDPNGPYGYQLAHTGAMVTANGIRRFHSGAALVNRLASDEVPAILQQGEAVIRKSAVEALGGAPAMARLNQGELPSDGGSRVTQNYYVTISAVDGGSVQRVVESRDFAEAFKRAASTNTYGVGTAVRETTR
jgi:hypothetical protein